MHYQELTTQEKNAYVAVRTRIPTQATGRTYRKQTMSEKIFSDEEIEAMLPVSIWKSEGGSVNKFAHCHCLQIIALCKSIKSREIEE